jgi:hypothetical protein
MEELEHRSAAEKDVIHTTLITYPSSRPLVVFVRPVDPDGNSIAPFWEGMVESKPITLTLLG